MQVQVDVGFNQLVKIAKKLPKTQWQKLKVEVENDDQSANKNNDLLEFLLNGPVFTEDQLNTMEETRRAINKWRAK